MRSNKSAARQVTQSLTEQAGEKIRMEMESCSFLRMEGSSFSLKSTK
ncbi:hypothetical protein NBRC111894_1247 [Sporolactobacillus inulinus]|uniref:Uncharacterized protein n=1 Tax=Sporolactobacillus inulinus TaxID=2078 RepID=A0A4Y1Z9T0_9BACL|nr:hypothetical protein NBRC111894_1247 [Sporolactobacillus inulinus]